MSCVRWRRSTPTCWSSSACTRPKFEHERDPDALAAAVERYGVAHPVLDDPELITWGQYAAKAWPTLAVVDPEGYLVASMAGEGHAEGLARLLDELIAVHDRKGTLRRGDGPYVPPPPSPRRRCASRARRSSVPDGTLLVADSAHHSVVELAADGETVTRRIGSGLRGRADGPAAGASFAEPGGLCRLPDAGGRGGRVRPGGRRHGQPPAARG